MAIPIYLLVFRERNQENERKCGKTGSLMFSGTEKLDRLTSDPSSGTTMTL